MNQRVLVIGATSRIAEETARIYATRGAALCLVGRDRPRLEAIASDLTLRGASAASTHVLDLKDVEDHAAMFDHAWQLLGDVDVALIAHGTLPDQGRCAEDLALALEEFATNATSTIALCAGLARRLNPGATLAVISSVAGDRGRASNWLYGSAKAAVSTALGGLRQQMHAQGVNVLTIKPGFVDTPMTREFRKSPLWAKADRVAAGIVKAIDRRRSIVYLPGFWRAIMGIIRAIPEPVFRRIRL